MESERERAARRRKGKKGERKRKGDGGREKGEKRTSKCREL